MIFSNWIHQSIFLAAVGDLFSRMIPYRERLFRLALAQLQNTADAEDAVQDVLIKAARKNEQFRSESTEYTWVVRILINHCHDIHRTRNRRSKREIDSRLSEIKAENIPDTRIHAAQNIELSDLSKHLMNAVNTLGPGHKPLILMRYFENMSYEQIAESMNINLGTVKSRMNQSKILLREALLKNGIEGGLF